MTNLPVDWEDNEGQKVDAAFLNTLDTNVNQGMAAIPQFGLRSALPSPGNAGATYYCTDCDAVYEDNGAAWVKVRIGAAAGPPMADPPTSGWTAVNMPTGGTFASDKDSMLFTSPSATSGFWFQYRAYPTPPFTLTTYIDFLNLSPTGLTALNSIFFGGIGISDGTKYILTGHAGTQLASTNGLFTIGTGLYVAAAKCSDAAGTGLLTGAYASAALPNIGAIPKWYRLVDNATTLSWQVSFNGIDWKTMASEARAAFLTPTRIGLLSTNTSGSSILLRLRSWSGVS